MQPIKEILQSAAQQLEKVTDAPQREARLLLAYILKRPKEWCIAHDNECITLSEYNHLQDFLQQRANHKPLAKVLGKKEFYGREFCVSDKVLDPRPDSELIIDCLKKYYPNLEQPLTILDVCTGSGCLIVTALQEYPNATGVALDISSEALALCRRNAIKVQNRVRILQGDLFEPIAKTNKKFDIIISNPPYIASNEINTLEETVKLYDPILALDGGADGLDFYQKILAQAGKYLKEQGLLILELGAGQYTDVKAITDNYSFEMLEIAKDLAGIERTLILQSY